MKIERKILDVNKPATVKDSCLNPELRGRKGVALRQTSGGTYVVKLDDDQMVFILPEDILLEE